jgi:phage gp45-like
MNTDIILRKLRQLYYRIISIVVRGYIEKPVTDDKYYPVLNISYLGKNTFVERINPYGLYTLPPVGLPVLKFSVFGKENNGAAIAYSQSTRFKNLEDSEVLVGNEKTQAYIKLNKDGDIEIKTDAKVKLLAAEIETEGNIALSVNGDVDVDAGSGTININSGQVNLDSGGTLKKIALDGDPVIGGGGGTIQASGNNYST